MAAVLFSTPCSALYAGYRADGLRAWKQNSGVRTYFLYDGDTLICEMNSSGGIVNAFGYGPNGLVQRYYASNSSVYYKAYTFDPDGNPVQRIPRFNTYPADTMVHDSGGLMWQDVSASSGGAYPELDPIGAGGQWGAYTDEQTRQQPVYNSQFSSGLVLCGSEYIDPSTGQPLKRDTWDEYKAAQLPYQVFSGIGKGFLNEAWKSCIGSAERQLADMGVSRAKLRNPRAQAILYRAENPFVVGDSPAERASAVFGGFSWHATGAFFAATGAVRGVGAEAREALGEGRTHIVYGIRDAEGRTVYVGRASGKGTAEEVLAGRLRDGRHKHYFPGQGDNAEVLGEQTSKRASQGAEEVWYEYYRLRGARLRNVDPPCSVKPGRLADTRQKIEQYAKEPWR